MLLTRLKGYKDDLEALKKSLKDAAKTRDKRAELLSGGRSPPAEDSEQHARLLQMNEQARKGTDRLKQATETALEAEAVGTNILKDLRSQRETLMHATGTLQRANEGLARGSRMLSAIARRAFANKLLMWLMILLLAGAIVLTLYLELFGASAVIAHSPPPPPE